MISHNSDWDCCQFTALLCLSCSLCKRFKTPHWQWVTRLGFDQRTAPLFFSSRFCSLYTFCKPESLYSCEPPSIRICFLRPNESDYFQLHSMCLMGGRPPTLRVTETKCCCPLAVSSLIKERKCINKTKMSGKFINEEWNMLLCVYAQ